MFVWAGLGENRAFNTDGCQWKDLHMGYGIRAQKNVLPHSFLCITDSFKKMHLSLGAEPFLGQASLDAETKSEMRFPSCHQNEILSCLRTCFPTTLVGRPANMGAP